jgi:hypothetical protein
MPTEIRTKVSGPQISLPPGFRLVTLREVGDAFAYAKANAADLGAATLIHVGRFDLSEFAVVLEPDEPLPAARRAFYAGMSAVADALAAHAPPEMPIEFGWPDALRVNGGLVGGGRLAWSDTPEGEVPDWLVFGVMIRTVSMGEGEPGLRPLIATLEEEGFEGLQSGQLAESFARHLMILVDAWQERGFRAVAESYLTRLRRQEGVSHSIVDNGDLLVRCLGRRDVERRVLLAGLAEPSWLDPRTGGPR